MTVRSYVQPRRFDQRVTFQRNTPTQSSTGDMVDSWANLVTCWAAVDGAKARGAEPEVSDQIISMRGYTVWIRSELVSRFSITVQDRISWNGRLLNIKDMPDQQKRGNLIAVMCDSGLNKG